MKTNAKRQPTQPEPKRQLSLLPVAGNEQTPAERLHKLAAEIGRRKGTRSK